MIYFVEIELGRQRNWDMFNRDRTQCVETDLQWLMAGRYFLKRVPWTNVVLMLGHRLRRWPNIKTTLVQGLVFIGFLKRRTSDTLNWAYVGSAWSERLRRWFDIEPAVPIHLVMRTSPPGIYLLPAYNTIPLKVTWYWATHARLR